MDEEMDQEIVYDDDGDMPFTIAELAEGLGLPVELLIAEITNGN